VFQSAIKAGLTGLLIFVGCGSLCAARTEADPLDAGFRQMYNLKFEAAHKIFENWEQTHPDDPLGPASDAAAYLFSEFDRLHILEIELFTDDGQLKDRRKVAPDPRIKAAFESKLAKADRIAAEIVAQSSNAADALFAQVLVNGLRGNYAALIEKENGTGLTFLKSSRSIAEKLIVIDPSYYDAYLAIGLENYLVGLRSAPMRWLLRISGAQADKNEGIAKLQTTAEKGHYLAPYARILLAIAAVRDKDSRTARTLLSSLAEEFPQNRLYRSELARLHN
jgi:hypothetical protein